MRRVKKIREDIKNRTFEKVYLLFGEEEFLTSRFRRMLSDAILPEGDMNRMTAVGKDPDLSTLRDFTDTLPLFSEKRLAVLQDTGLFKTKAEGFEEWLRGLPDSAVVIFSETEVDKRTRLFKTVSELGYAAEFKRPTENELERFVLKQIGDSGLKIRKEDYSLLLSRLPRDYGRAASELSKVLLYSSSEGVISRDGIEKLLLPAPDDRVFRMISAAISGRREEALSIYYDLLSLDTPPIQILILLSREIRKLVLTKEALLGGKTPAEIRSLTGSPDFAVSEMIRNAKKHPLEKLEEWFSLSLGNEEKLKTGDLNEYLAVELVLFGLDS